MLEAGDIIVACGLIGDLMLIFSDGKFYLDSTSVVYMFFDPL